MQEVEIKLSDWVFHAIEHQEVLTLYREVLRHESVPSKSAQIRRKLT